jgi:hypothetical protein
MFFRDTIKLCSRKTAFNVIVNAPLKGRATQNPSRRKRLWGILFRHIFAVAGTLAVSFIATAKTSFTTETLCAICFEPVMILWRV